MAKAKIEAEDMAWDQAKVKEEIKKLITRKTKLNGGVNRAIRYAKIIKRIFPKKQASAFTPPRAPSPTRTGRAGGGACARVVSQSRLIPFKAKL